MGRRITEFVDLRGSEVLLSLLISFGDGKPQQLPRFQFQANTSDHRYLGYVASKIAQIAEREFFRLGIIEFSDRREKPRELK